MKLKLFWIYVLAIVFMLGTGVSEEHKVVIFLVGDSTMAEKLSEKRPETGWGEMLYKYMRENVMVKNHAKNGRSTKSFIEEGRWQTVIDIVKPGDYVFIQFGHNDESRSKIGRYTSPVQYGNNLRKFVKDTRAKKAFPVLLTPVVRRRFNDRGEFYDTHGEYPDIVRKIAKELNVIFVDHHRLSEILIRSYGEEKSKELFLHLEPGKNINYPEGVEDNTHFSSNGAKLMAEIIAREIRALNIKLSEFVNLEE
ncbi:MAG: rhamnogalacturonan acetylesterase [Melioribacteraceae bacterium]|nr:rhamnogalacturonan acetylesterase [Melioribacteraceae bacterium]